MSKSMTWKARTALLAALVGLTALLAACQKAPEPNLDQEEGNAVDNAVAEIEDVPDDGLVAADGAINDTESEGEVVGNSH